MFSSSCFGPQLTVWNPRYTYVLRYIYQHGPDIPVKAGE